MDMAFLRIGASELTCLARNATNRRIELRRSKFRESYVCLPV